MSKPFSGPGGAAEEIEHRHVGHDPGEVGGDVAGDDRAESDEAPEPEHDARDPGYDLEEEAHGVGNPPRQFFDHRQGGKDRDGDSDDQSDGRAFEGAHDQRPRPVAGADGVQYTVRLDRVGICVARSPRSVEKEANAVVLDGRHRLDSEHSDDCAQGGEGEQGGKAGPPAQPVVA